VDLAFGRLGWTFEQKLFSRALLGSHLTGVLLSSQTVGANVGVRLPEAIELQWERKKELKREKGKGTEIKANSCSKIPPTWGGARAVLFIEEVKGLVKMPSMPLTTYPANRVHGQRG
jgi:hypothetical protein